MPTLLNNAGHIVEGVVQAGSEESKLYFTPADTWKTGEYKLIAEGRLADLAGNNLNRLFDVDLESKDSLPSNRKSFERKWLVE